EDGAALEHRDHEMERVTSGVEIQAGASRTVTREIVNAAPDDRDEQVWRKRERTTDQRPLLDEERIREQVAGDGKARFTGEKSEHVSDRRDESRPLVAVRAANEALETHHAERPRDERMPVGDVADDETVAVIDREEEGREATHRPSESHPVH